ncbi:hypothetical protein [Caballeronia grimmiae]|uniref:hypothetical protein n=1 Tax=Caballeronia grimmiae TaxID=1071679 RepID=UPI0038B6CD17
MKLIAGFIVATLWTTTVHTEQGDAEDRALVESYKAHMNETPSAGRSTTAHNVNKPASQDSTASSSAGEKESRRPPPALSPAY